MRIILNFTEASSLMPDHSKTTNFTLVLVALFFLASLLALPAAAVAGATSQPELRITNGHFEPAKLVVPTGQPLQLKIVNDDHGAVEFESFDLHREQVVAPGETITVYLPALAPGSYPFFDDFHRGSAHGIIVSR